MGKKKRGHYCKACGRTRANEKFSGKGHRLHICKDCKRNGKKAHEPSTSNIDREVHRLNKAIKNCLIFYTQRLSFFLFEYHRERYITRDDFESEIFLYQKQPNQNFIVVESMQMTSPLMEVLFKKYHETLENGLVLDYEEIVENEFLDLSKKRKQHLEVILSMNNLM
ncbi:hypothetical protein [Bacillus sp. B15-48]|uniref:hypothetical protein n=1 Tax=Bacillus sp. B15-48 TaxID=1548601 RepID=UPI00193F7B12|nr:hypothetical protein [Bacillus sp. B15-48]MBM4764981.1 hypothetical protein [Bacillus sp. B15-48]